MQRTRCKSERRKSERRKSERRKSRARRPGMLAGAILIALLCDPDAGIAFAGEDALLKVDFKTSRGTPDKVALLVGIADYPDSINQVWADLDGPINDTVRVHQVLTESFGFDPEDIKILTDERATHENIVRGFNEWLIQRAGPKTEVVFWYCGHGSRVPDQSRAEDAEFDGMDSTFLAWDSRMYGFDGENDMTDDELHSLVRALTEKTERVTIVTDSCHSGGTMRGGGTLKARSAPPGTKGRDKPLAFWPPDIPYLDDDSDLSADPTRYVHISACSSRELALEWRLPEEEGGKSYGALTLFLTYSMEGAGPLDTYRMLADKTRTWLAFRGLTQSVECSGEKDRRIFAGTFQPRPPGFAVLSWPTRRTVTIQAGALLGVQVRSQFRLLGLDGTEHTTATVIRNGASECEARLSDTAPAWLQEVPLRAVLATQPGTVAPLQTYVQDKELAAALAGNPKLVLDPREPPRAVYTLRIQEQGDESRALFAAPDGVPIWRSDPLPDTVDHESLAAAFEEAVTAETRYREANHLLGTGGQLALAGHFRGPTAAELKGPREGERWGKRAVASHVRLAHPLADGVAEGSFLAEIDQGDKDAMSLAALVVKNTNEKPVYVSVLSISEDRQINPITPQKGDALHAVEPGEETTIFVALAVNELLGLDRPVLDRYLLIATDKPADFSSFTQKSVMRGGGGLPGVIRRALGFGDAEEDYSVTAGGSDFGVTAVDLFLRNRSQP